MRDDDPYDRDEFVFRTDGRDVCHWCALRRQTMVWGPYGTRTCDECMELIDQGRQWEVVEVVAARITVREGWIGGLDAERWRRHEHDLLARWLKVRTTARRIEPDDDDDH